MSNFNECIVVEKKNSLSDLIGFTDIYIGRPSILGNPYKLENEYQREEVISKYRKWLAGNEPAQNELRRIARLLVDGHKIRLLCYCSPKPCHGDVIKQCVLGIIKNNAQDNVIETTTKKIFGVTGHRSDKLGGYDFNSQLKLVKFAEQVLLEHNPDKVITGMALGWDRAIAVACFNLSIPYIAAVPFRNQYIKWSKHDQETHFKLLEAAKQIVYVDELIDYQDFIDGVSIGEFHVSKMQRRNEYIVDNSTHLLALYNGTPGGTKNCCDYARKQTKNKIQIINVWSRFAPILNPQEDEFDKVLAVETGVEGISLHDMGLPEILTIDVVEEIQQEKTANIINAIKEPEETQDDEYQEDEFDKLLYDEIANEFLGITKLDENGKEHITYPHQLNPSLEFSPYNAVCNTGKFIHVDEEYLAANLHWKPNFDYQSCEWEPKRIKDYRDSRRLYLDIETTGLNPNDSRIILIGMMLEGAYVNEGYLLQEKYDIFTKGYILECDEYKGCELEGEKRMLNSLFMLVDALKPEAIVTHNGFDFDFYYIIRRCEILGIKHPMTRYDGQERKITAAEARGKPIVYCPVYWAKPSRGDRVFNDGSFPQLVDTYHLAGQHDKIFRNMTGLGLKYLAFYVGFRKEKRLELKGKQIREYWLSGDEAKRQLVRDYLIFDLEDQRAVTNFFLVSCHYQQMYFPLALQEICVASPARKHNANLVNFYRRFYGKQIPLGDGTNVFYNEPISDEKVGYEGALVSVNPGVYRNFFKLDLASLYPSIVLTYGLMNLSKDPLGVFFKTMYTLRALRLVYKDLGGDEPTNVVNRNAYNDLNYLFSDLDLNNIQAADKKIFKGVDNSLKVGINGGYGFLGVGFYNFNDIVSAALVTAYGRIIITKISQILSIYSLSVEKDTDGEYGTPKQITDVPEKYRKPVKHPKTGELIEFGAEPGYDTVSLDYIWGAVQQELPEGINIDLELRCPDGAIYAPAMKNYIYWKTPESKPTTKGLYRQRGRNELQKEFPIEFIRRWAFESKKDAHEYSNEWIQKLSGFVMNNGNLLKKHTIQDPKKLKGDEKALNKALLAANCGEVGETIYYYWGSRQHYTQSGKNIGRKSGVKPFPIRRYMDKRPNNHQVFPCDAKDIIKAPNIEKYITDAFLKDTNDSKVIPYNKEDKENGKLNEKLNELLDMGLLEKLMFTQNIAKRRFNKNGQPCKCLKVDNGLGQTGDNVTFYWASIQKKTPTGKLSAKCDRFPVRVIINDDDTLSINLQDIPPNIDTSLINLNFNVEWYMKDFLKIRNEILKVVDKETE